MCKTISFELPKMHCDRDQQGFEVVFDSRLTVSSMISSASTEQEYNSLIAKLENYAQTILHAKSSVEVGLLAACSYVSCDTFFTQEMKLDQWYWSSPTRFSTDLQGEYLLVHVITGFCRANLAHLQMLNQRGKSHISTVRYRS